MCNRIRIVFPVMAVVVMLGCGAPPKHVGTWTYSALGFSSELTLSAGNTFSMTGYGKDGSMESVTISGSYTLEGSKLTFNPKEVTGEKVTKELSEKLIAGMKADPSLAIKFISDTEIEATSTDGTKTIFEKK